MHTLDKNWSCILIASRRIGVKKFVGVENIIDNANNQVYVNEIYVYTWLNVFVLTKWASVRYFSWLLDLVPFKSDVLSSATEVFSHASVFIVCMVLYPTIFINEI